MANKYYFEYYNKKTNMIRPGFVFAKSENQAMKIIDSKVDTSNENIEIQMQLVQ